MSDSPQPMSAEPAPRRRARRRVLAVALSLGLLGAVFVAAVIYQFRPLVPFGNYTASYVVGESEPRQAQTYEMLFRQHVVFVHMPVVEDYPFRWFAIDWSTGRVYAPHGPRTVPYLSHNQDEHLGVPVTLAVKMDAEWTVTRREREIVFSDGRLTVTVQKP